jgi:hypothetical protein
MVVMVVVGRDGRVTVRVLLVVRVHIMGLLVVYRKPLRGRAGWLVVLMVDLVVITLSLRVVVRVPLVGICN